MTTFDERRVFDTLTEAGDAADRTEARNGLRHVVSLSMTKLADGLINPKLVLTWLAGALGAPAAVTGLLVPIREAGALLPQMLLAGPVQGMAHRKWAWVLGSLGQGIAAAGMVAVALTLEGRAAGLALCALLALLALSRSAASVSYKDVLGKTVRKTRRGSVTGTAASVASVGVLVFALLLMSGLLETVAAVALAIGLASILWLVAGALFSRLEEEASAEAGEAPVIDLAPWREDAQFRRFVYARGALTATALAPPYIVLLEGEGGALQALGALVLASAAASFVSSYVWGRLADRSSRQVLVLAGFAGGAAMALAALAGALGWAATAWVAPLVLFGLMVAYHGVRQGRSTYLVDMAPEDARARYAALANTLIGGLLLLTGAFGGALAFVGPVAALAGFAVLSALGGVLALGLKEVERAG
ncbi:MFS transporter [Salipiger mucosus]|uniref:Permease of the major facilitator superfamily n=1 Tax=Salipiger mucosus DSM 16094 TaxID=1123237 RepID=S9RDU5_9RHOB|nr:MFS transporter [Salipiger mucosus]EPX76300.1 Permease of the major facilitator superfamily [Salipiger mucosus DSM 16094]